MLFHSSFQKLLKIFSLSLSDNDEHFVFFGICIIVSFFCHFFCFILYTHLPSAQFFFPQYFWPNFLADFHSLMCQGDELTWWRFLHYGIERSGKSLCVPLSSSWLVEISPSILSCWVWIVCIDCLIHNSMHFMIS